MNLPIINETALSELKDKNENAKLLHLRLGELTVGIDGLVEGISIYMSRRNGIAEGGLIQETKQLLDKLENNPAAPSAPAPAPASSAEPSNQPQDFSYVNYCTKIFKTTNQPWLHVEQIAVIFKDKYGLVKDKHTIASILRKHAKRGKHFKAYGGNRFGLLEQL